MIQDNKTSNIVNGINLILKSNPKAILSTSAYGDPTIFIIICNYNSSLILTEEEEELLETNGWVKNYDSNNLVRSWEILV